jgi:hypothetical protein
MIRASAVNFCQKLALNDPAASRQAGIPTALSTGENRKKSKPFLRRG